MSEHDLNYQIEDPVKLFIELDKLICLYTQRDDPNKLKCVNELISFLWSNVSEDEKFIITHS